jgi:DNA-binding phage protein
MTLKTLAACRAPETEYMAPRRQAIIAKRKTSVRRKGSAELARETNLGSHLLVFNDNEVIELLRAAVQRKENQTAFARRHGIERTRLNRILKGKRSVTRAVVKALGLRKVYTPE